MSQAEDDESESIRQQQEAEDNYLATNGKLHCLHLLFVIHMYKHARTHTVARAPHVMQREVLRQMCKTHSSL